mmetsp:Transcript_5061/g.16037  ORF Transcript_5061/g.16037 Transcript_5061/m.16037 type:complete len:637 (-) Transcript_5061:47-1957(-)
MAVYRTRVALLSGLGIAVVRPQLSPITAAAAARAWALQEEHRSGRGEHRAPISGAVATPEREQSRQRGLRRREQLAASGAQRVHQCVRALGTLTRQCAGRVGGRLAVAAWHSKRHQRRGGRRRRLVGRALILKGPVRPPIADASPPLRDGGSGAALPALLRALLAVARAGSQQQPRQPPPRRKLVRAHLDPRRTHCQQPAEQGELLARRRRERARGGQSHLVQHPLRHVRRRVRLEQPLCREPGSGALVRLVSLEPAEDHLLGRRAAQPRVGGVEQHCVRLVEPSRVREQLRLASRVQSAVGQLPPGARQMTRRTADVAARRRTTALLPAALLSVGCCSEGRPTSSSATAAAAIAGGCSSGGQRLFPTSAPSRGRKLERHPSARRGRRRRHRQLCADNAVERQAGEAVQEGALAPLVSPGALCRLLCRLALRLGARLRGRVGGRLLGLAALLAAVGQLGEQHLARRLVLPAPRLLQRQLHEQRVAVDGVEACHPPEEQDSPLGQLRPVRQPQQQQPRLRHRARQPRKLAHEQRERRHRLVMLARVQVLEQRGEQERAVRREGAAPRRLPAGVAPPLQGRPRPHDLKRVRLGLGLAPAPCGGAAGGARAVVADEAKAVVHRCVRARTSGCASNIERQ